jgi:2-dehydro-3-deoxygluconokinase
VRAALGCSDRGHTAVSQLKPGDVDWEKIFGEEGARWFHTGGIFCALSETTPEVAREAMEAARRHGAVVSYDLNYRDSLWKSIGGRERAREVNRELASLVDVMIGNEEDFTACLGFEVEGLDEQHSKLDVENFRKMIERAVIRVPELQSRRDDAEEREDGDVERLGRGLLHERRAIPSGDARRLRNLRPCGRGDSFASGLIYGFLNARGAQWAVECGAAHGALAMTTPGDTTMATLSEVERVMKGGGARVAR